MRQFSRFFTTSIPNALQAVRRVVRAAFAPEEPVLADGYVQSVRTARCQLCPHLSAGRCEKCTCYISLKTMFATEECPEGKWYRQNRYWNGL